MQDNAAKPSNALQEIHQRLGFETYLDENWLQKSEVIIPEVTDLITLCKNMTNFILKSVENLSKPEIVKNDRKNSEMNNLFSEISSSMVQNNKFSSSLKNFFEICGQVTGSIANNRTRYENCVQQEVLDQLQTYLIPLKKIGKTRKSLDLARNKLKSTRTKLSSMLPTVNNLPTIQTQYMDSYRNAVDLEETYMTLLYSISALRTDIIHAIRRFFILTRDFHYNTNLGMESKLSSLEELIEVDSCRVFGLSLFKLNDNSGQRISAVIISFCSILEQSGALEEEGIFRVAGSGSKSKYYQALMDHKILTEQPPQFDCHSFASAFKRYIQQLPESLIDNSYINDYSKIMKFKSKAEKLAGLKDILSNFNVILLVNLEYVLAFLVKVTSLSSRNLMTASNLSIIFGPNMLKPNEVSSDLHHINTVFNTSLLSCSITELLIDNFAYLFPNYKTSTTRHSIRRCALISSELHTANQLPAANLKRANLRESIVFGECIQTYSLRIKSKLVPAIRICLSCIDQFPVNFDEEVTQTELDRTDEIEKFINCLTHSSFIPENTIRKNSLVAFVVFKKYLQMLPNPLSDSRIFDEWIKICPRLTSALSLPPNERIGRICSLYNKIPKILQINFRYIFDHLGQVVRDAPNRANLINALAKHLGPLIFRRESLHEIIVEEVWSIIELFKLIIISLDENILKMDSPDVLEDCEDKLWDMKNSSVRLRK